MAERPAEPRDNTPVCPDCGSDLTFVASWTFRGLWGYNEAQTWECSAHGPLFISTEAAARSGIGQTLGPGRDDGDRDSPIPARCRPKAPLKSGAMAVAEPDSD